MCVVTVRRVCERLVRVSALEIVTAPVGRQVAPPKGLARCVPVSVR